MHPVRLSAHLCTLVASSRFRVTIGRVVQRHPRHAQQEPAVTNPEEEDFATMFEASAGARRFQRGQAVDGTIVAIGPEVALVDIGAKGEAQIDVAELKDAEGDIEVNVGDRIQAVVVRRPAASGCRARACATPPRSSRSRTRSGPGSPWTARSRSDEGWLRSAHRPRACLLPVVPDRCHPHRRPCHPRGAHLLVPDHRVQDGGKDIVVSRRKLLEEEQRASAAQVRQSIVPGAVLEGRVVSVRDFGAFVDLGGGIQGLLHVSEMGWSRVTTPGEVVAAGDEIAVKVLRVDDATQKVSLGLKQLQDDPWGETATKYGVGQVRQGRVTRLAEFGAFVELEPGIKGWHTPRPSRRPGAPAVGRRPLPWTRSRRSRSSASTSPRSGSVWRWSRKGPRERPGRPSPRMPLHQARS